MNESFLGNKAANQMIFDLNDRILYYKDSSLFSDWIYTPVLSSLLPTKHTFH